jgi:tetratricopeptide (TPR) repeat protein
VARQQQSLTEPGVHHERLKASILSRATEAKRRRRKTPLVLAFAAGLGAVAIAAYVRSSSTPRDLVCFVGNADTPSRVGTWMSAPDSQTLKIRFSDGTRASLWPDARGRVTHLNPYGADLVVEQGRASFDVVHREHGHWQISTGPFVVQVTGTRFDLEWQPEKDRFELRLYAGRVRVSGCALGDGQEVSAGQRLEASCVRHEYGISALEKAPTLAELSVGRGADADGPAVPPELRARATQPHEELAEGLAEAKAPEAGRSGSAPPSLIVSAPPVVTQGLWLTLARAGRFTDAYDAALAAGFESESLAHTASEVLLLGDAARLSGHIERARQAYQSVRQRWPGSNEAALAAFQVGRAEFDQRRNYAESENWLRLYLSEQPNGEFTAPAMGRLMEAEIHLNRYESARVLAKSYLDRYPKGSHADAAHRVLDASAAGAP